MKKWRLMMNAYSEIYLDEAQNWLGEFFETATYVLETNLEEAWFNFFMSHHSLMLASGDPFTICGKSGSEVALELCGKKVNKLPFIYDRTPEYWLGYVLAYYQWYKNISFSYIANHIDINIIFSLYKKYHEIDITHLCNELDRLYKLNQKETNLKKYRKYCGLSQKQLSLLTSIPLRTIQQYEQRQKNINKAQANYVVSLAQALKVSVKDLLE